MQDMRCIVQIEQACEQSRMMRARYDQVDVLISGPGRNFFRWVSDEENPVTYQACFLNPLGEFVE